MDIIKSYSDLCEEIEIWKTRIEAYKAEIKALKKLAKFDGPREVTGIDYSQPYVRGTSQIGFEEALERLGELENHIFIHQNTIEQLERSREDMERRIDKLEGIDKKVVYMRDIKEKSLKEIAEELGYSYDYIREVSSRNKKPTLNPQTSEN